MDHVMDGNIMLGSRTIKTLTALLVSMTVGALVLMVLETSPGHPPAEQLAAVSRSRTPIGGAIYDTVVPIQSIKWRNIVVHSSSAGGSGIEQRCHFVVQPDGRVAATDLWQRQLAGHHVYVPGRDFNADSIGICMVGDFSSRGPSQRQFDGLVELTRSLQGILLMPADRVYLHSHLAARSHSPGDAFPAMAFNDGLLRR